jgi:2-dehydro-3-deoxy-D-gluconate 5-dehydrogenase
VTNANPTPGARPDPFDLTGRVAVVTGGNGGIGLAMAEGLARAGASVAVVGRDVAKTGRAAARIAEEQAVATLPVVADVADERQVERAVAEVLGRFGRLDVLINNAGVTVRTPPEAQALDDWRKVLDINLTGVFLMSKAAYPALKQGGGGKVINIGSLASIFGVPYAPSYAASKGGVVQLTRSLALAWARDNIQVNAILPGWFETDMTDGARRVVAGLYERVLARTPQGRWGQPSDIAGTAVWLAAPASDFVTGAAIPVDGGFSAAL